MPALKPVTGKGAGLSGDDQIRIALRTIGKHGGAATIHHIYEAVEALLNPNGSTLSQQGKASLRSFINRTAVEAGYLQPHDTESPGWHLTPQGQAFLAQIENTTTHPDTPTTPPIEKPAILRLVPIFLAIYPAEAKDQIWRQHTATFRRFWSERVLAPGAVPIPDPACDDIIRILDTHGKGNTPGCEAVANTMVPQGAWRRILNGFRTDKKLANLVHSILAEKNPEKKANLLDDLFEMNKRNKNRLTGKTAVTINALLAAYDPVNDLTMVSLNDRKTLIDFLNLKVSFAWDTASIGHQITHSNALIRQATTRLGVKASARTQSCFWYYPPVKALWKPEHTVKRPDRNVSVTVPQDSGAVEMDHNELRESLQMQAALAEIGSHMGFTIWLPKSDRARILTKWKPDAGTLLDELPLNYDDTTLSTIEQIDVIWLKRRSIVRAFEVEHTTSVYSGLLRMADLIALQPNMVINLHIVAPATKRAKVFQEIRRPVFSLLEGGALSEKCTFLSYESVADLRQQKLLKHLAGDVLAEYEERAEGAD